MNTLRLGNIVINLNNVLICEAVTERVTDTYSFPVIRIVSNNGAIQSIRITNNSKPLAEAIKIAQEMLDKINKIGR